MVDSSSEGPLPSSMGVSSTYVAGLNLAGVAPLDEMSDATLSSSSGDCVPIGRRRGKKRVRAGRAPNMDAEKYTKILEYEKKRQFI